MLLATVFSQAVVAPKASAKAKATVPKPAAKAKVAVKAPAAKAKIAVKKPAAKAKVSVKKPAAKAKVAVKAKATAKPKINIKIGSKAKTGAKVTVKAAPKKANLSGSCPAAKSFKSLEVLSKPIEYKTQTMCKNLKSGCCSEKSLDAFKQTWPVWVKAKSAFFWTLSKWPLGLAMILKYQDTGLRCKLQPKKGTVKGKVTVKATKKTKRILQAVVSKKPAAKANVAVKGKVAVKPKAKVSVKAKVPKVKVNVKAGLKKTGDAVKKAGAQISASAKKAGAKISASAKKIGAQISAGAKKTGDAIKKGVAKAKVNINAGIKKAGDAIKKTGAKISAGIKKAGDDAKKFGLKIKAKISAAFKKTTPADWMKNTGCNALFKDAWKQTMPFMRMRKAAAALGLKCFKAVAKARSSAVCAVCDNSTADKFKTGFNIGGPFVNEIPQACAPFLSWVGSYYKVQAAIAKYAEATTMKTPLTVNSDALAKTAAKWESDLGSCFTDARRLQAVVSKKPAAKAKVAVKGKVAVKKPAVKGKVAVKKPAAKAKIAVKKPAAKAKVAVKGKVAVKKPAAKAKISVKKPAAKAKVTVKKPAAKAKVGIKIKVGTKGKKAAKPAIKYTVGKHGWSLKAGQQLTSLDTSFSAYEKARQAGDWTGKVTDACVNSPLMKKWTAKLILANTMDDIKFSRMFWKGALELNERIGRGSMSKFAKFLGKKLLGIQTKVNKMVVKLKASAKSIGDKIKEGIKKAGDAIKKTGAKISAEAKKAGAKISAGAKKIGAQIKAGAKKTGDAIKKTAGKISASVKKAGAKISASAKKVGAQIKAGAKKTGDAIKKTAKKASASVKAAVKAPKVKVNVKAPKVKVSAKANVKASAKTNRRLQTVTPAPAPATADTGAPAVNVSANGVNLANPTFQANVPQPTGLAGDGQAAPAKSWMMFAGMMTLVALLFN